MGKNNRNSGLGTGGAGGGVLAPAPAKSKKQKTSTITYTEAKGKGGDKYYRTTVNGVSAEIEYSASSPANPYTAMVGDGNPRIFKDLKSAKDYVKKQLTK